MLGDPQEAEDAVQQTFLAAYSDLISTDKPIHLRPWLFTIARNRCYTLLRGRREQPTSELEEPVTEGLASQVQRREDLRELVVDLRRLPDEQRAALVLAELDSLSHEEIAIALGVPREKVKALVFQARESLVASRTARETDCADIREQLATQRGGALRRGNLRRHLRECAGCRDFRRQVEHQRRQLAALLPVVPTVALKEGVLGGTIGGGAAASVGTGGMIVSTALKSGLAKGALGALLAGAGAAGTIVATHGFQAPARQPADAAVLPSAGGTTTSGSRTIAEEAKAASVSQAGSYAAASSTPASGGAGLTALSSASECLWQPEWIVHPDRDRPQSVQPAARNSEGAERRNRPALAGAGGTGDPCGLAGRARDCRPADDVERDDSGDDVTDQRYDESRPGHDPNGHEPRNRFVERVVEPHRFGWGAEGRRRWRQRLPDLRPRHDRVGLRWLHARSGSRQHGQHGQHGQHRQHRQHGQHGHGGTPAAPGRPATPGPRAAPATPVRAAPATPPAAATRGRRRATSGSGNTGTTTGSGGTDGSGAGTTTSADITGSGSPSDPAADTAVSVSTTTISTVPAGTTRGETATDTVIQ